MGRKYIEEKWLSFRGACVSKDASESQVDQSKKIFYAGSLVMFNAVAMEMGEAGKEEADIQKLNDIAAELDLFTQDVKKQSEALLLQRVMHEAKRA
jgi:hypothetical protein